MQPRYLTLTRSNCPNGAEALRVRFHNRPTVARHSPLTLSAGERAANVGSQVVCSPMPTQRSLLCGWAQQEFAGASCYFSSCPQPIATESSPGLPRH